MRTLNLILCLLVAPAPALAAKPKATLVCTTAGGVTLPSKTKPRLAEPITCVVTVTSPGTFMTTIATRTGTAKGPDHSGDAFKGTPHKAELAVGKDFATCTSFQIEAKIESDTSQLLWSKKLDIKQDCKEGVAAEAGPAIQGKFAFPFLKAKKVRCAKVAGKLLTTLKRDYTCVVPAKDEGGSASGVKVFATCKAKKGDETFGVYESAKDCAKERDTQIANAEGA
jgi:hypothetical protein